MEGYSVTEAASVLGVPTERVWELLARGVLSGAPEGETGMRVFLQPRPAPSPTPAAVPPPENGGTREPERELSPFRELLTEFRNLTERYGQALLALGESRGEVAALRSRVDLLEARMDLRLSSEPQAPAWPPTPMPLPAERQVPDGATTPASARPDEAGDEEEDHRARRRGPRRATESFAEALARAEDPSVPELPGRAEAAAAAAASQPEVTLPRDAAVAEPMPLPEQPAVAEPMPLPEQPAVAEPVAVPEAPVIAADVSPETGVSAVGKPVPASGEQPLYEDVDEGVDEGDRIDDDRTDAVAAEAGAPPPEPIDFDADRYTTHIEEPDWLAAEAFDSEAKSTARGMTPVETSPMAESHLSPTPEADDQEASGAAEMEVVVGHPSPSTDEAAAGGEGPATRLPGASDLDEALRSLGMEPTPAAPDPEPPPSDAEPPTETDHPDDAAPAADDAGPDAGPAGGPSSTETATWGADAASTPDQSVRGPTSAEADQQAAADHGAEPEWPPRAQRAFEPRRSPNSLTRLTRPSPPPAGRTQPFGTSPAHASRAYRRLRRIFPG